jgi:hypothetical protein
MSTTLLSKSRAPIERKGKAKRPFTRSSAPAFDLRAIHTSPIVPQFELEVGPADDAYEREADAVADAVVAGTELDDPSTGASGIQRVCSGCASEDEELRRSPSQGASSSVDRGGDSSARIARARASGGVGLPHEARGFFESRFGADFSGVRLHNDGEAASLSRQFQARAFTVGRDIFFGAGQLNLGSDGGRHLVAHELTHTIQQSGAVQPKLDE